MSNDGAMNALDRLTAKAEELGSNAGHAAGTWATDGNTTTETYRTLLAMIEDDDPAFEIPSATPDGRADEYDEFRDSLDTAREAEEITELDELSILDEYQMAFDQAFVDEVERAARYQVDA
jgi:hypothetical protein